MLTTSVLVLNRSYFPVHVTNLKRAFCLLYQGIARAMDEEYRTFDFQSWTELTIAAHNDKIGIIGKVIRVPRIIVLVAYDRMPKRNVRFSRLNILLRDRHTCQYCGKGFTRNALNLDHVHPRSKGGQTTWDNVVTSCHDCNRKKGGRTPQEAHMRLVRAPFRPASLPFFDLSKNRVHFKEWRPFLNFVDFSYWNVELEP